MKLNIGKLKDALQKLSEAEVTANQIRDLKIFCGPTQYERWVNQGVSKDKLVLLGEIPEE